MIPLYSLYFDEKGEGRRFTYIECRYFYCHWYERFASASREFKKLRKWRKKGVTLQIVGYARFRQRWIRRTACNLAFASLTSLLEAKSLLKPSILPASFFRRSAILRASCAASGSQISSTIGSGTICRRVCTFPARRLACSSVPTAALPSSTKV